jgi:hypothetical protein
MFLVLCRTRIRTMARPSATAAPAAAAGPAPAETTETALAADTAAAAATTKPVVQSSPLLSGYLTLAVASVINYSSALKEGVVSPSAVPATTTERRYATAVALVSLVVVSVVLFLHFLLRFQRLRIWVQPIFEPKSKYELCLALFLVRIHQ